MSRVVLLVHQKRRREGSNEEKTMDEELEFLGADSGALPFRSRFIMGANDFLSDLRSNALYLQGLPIAHLPTNNIFGYARHFDTEPVGMEWIDDQSCVLIFPSSASCQTALNTLRKSLTEEPDVDDCFTAKPVPVVLWPAEDRINKTLGASEGLAGPLVVRIARNGDKKIRGAKSRSHFYRKHGTDAGKDPNAHSIGRDEENGHRKRKRDEGDDEEQRRRLDDELDNFLHDDDEDDGDVPASPPSKMRSDQIIVEQREGAKRQDSLLQKTLIDRVYKEDENERKRGKRGGRGRRRDRPSRDEEPKEIIESDAQTVEGGRRAKRPKKTLQELDDELQAFLDERN